MYSLCVCSRREKKVFWLGAYRFRGWGLFFLRIVVGWLVVCVSSHFWLRQRRHGVWITSVNTTIGPFTEMETDFLSEERKGFRMLCMFV